MDFNVKTHVVQPDINARIVAKKRQDTAQHVSMDTMGKVVNTHAVLDV